jgi:peroxiredoxin
LVLVGVLALSVGGCSEDQWTAADLARLSNAPAPRLVLADLHDDTVDTGTLRGRVGIVYFWTSGCGGCRKDLGLLDALYRELNAGGLTVLLVNVGEDRPTVNRAVRRQQYAAPVVPDPECRAAALYGVRAIPTLFIIGRDGMVRGRAVSTRGWSGPVIYPLLDALLREPPDRGPAPSPGKPLWLRATGTSQREPAAGLPSSCNR